MITELPKLFANIAPPPGIGGGVLAVLQMTMLATSFSKEQSEPTVYSKFASLKEKDFDNAIPTRRGMIRIYAPAAVTAALFLAFMSKPVTPLLLAHFLKRLFEVMAVHNYSGTMPASQANVIGTYYALITFMMASLALPADQMEPVLQTTGYALFVIGSLGNLFHHVLLARLRSGNNVKRYVAPQGGLFAFVAAPHYLFEVIAWLGMALVAQQTNALLVSASMASYLGGRAVATNNFYKETFTQEEWPGSRKAIVPLIL